MTAAELLVEARKASGLTQSQLAERSGVPQPAISAYERGRRIPGADMFLRLLAANGATVQLDYRITRTTEDSPSGQPTTSTPRDEHVLPTLPDSPQARALHRHRADVERIAARYGATNLRVFGSVARGEARPDSDIDIVFDYNRELDLMAIIDFGRELETLLGYSIDIGGVRDFKDHALTRILTEAVPMWSPFETTITAP